MMAVVWKLVKFFFYACSEFQSFPEYPQRHFHIRWTGILVEKLKTIKKQVIREK